MKRSRFFVTLLLIAGLVFMVSSNSVAKTRFTLDKASIEHIIEQSRQGKGLVSDGYTRIASEVKLHNKSDKPLIFDIAVTFVDAEKEKLGEATKTRRIDAGESKAVSTTILLDPELAERIDSGYVTITNTEDEEDKIDIESHSMVATVSDDAQGKIDFNPDRYIRLNYDVKLRNKSSRPVTPDLTIAFLDKNNVKIGQARTTGSFDAGELKTISDTIVLRTSDASRIASTQVTIKK